MAPHLLPSNSTPVERSLSLAADFRSRLYPGVARGRGIKLVDTPSSFLPFLVFEYGLGELSPYVPNLYNLISEGIKWQRVRGTPAAVARALAWLTYSAAIEEWPTGRRKWNLFMLALDRVRDSEVDLPRIDGVANLSVPLRSYFWRGFHGYDIRALDFSASTYSNALYSDFSGVRIAGANAKWSYGRRYENTHVLTEAEGIALDNWIEPADDEPGPWWDFPWPDAPWESSAAAAREAAMAAAMPSGPAWAVFKDADGNVVGYRRCRAYHRVVVSLGGSYRLGSTRYAPSPIGSRVYLEAMTDFGDGYGLAPAASVGFAFGGAPASPLRPGSLWLPAGGLAGATAVIGEFPISISFGRTVRERVCSIVRF